MFNDKSVKKMHTRSLRVSSLSQKLVKPPRRSLFNAIVKTAENFCKESSFHGLKNLWQSARGLRNSNISKYVSDGNNPID